MHKKFLSVLLAAVMSSACVQVFAEESPHSQDFVPDVVYNFGSTDVEGAITVAADTEYTAARGYGFFGIKEGYKTDVRVDGWTMTQGYDLVLENGGDGSNVADTWVSTTVREVNGADYISPIRFAMFSPTNSYYRIRVNLRRADAAKEARVNLFTEKRHQRLIDEPIPAEGLVYEGTVHVHNNWSKSTNEYVDTMLNIAAEGENVAISSIEVKKLDTAKTLWILGDSTVCEQSAAIPYFPLEHCQGIGSAMIKYLGDDWSLVNEAESGLSAASARNHFSNFVNDIQKGDIVWFEFGHNDDKSSTDPAANGYLEYLENYYNAVSAKGAYFIAVAPVTRCTSGQFVNGVWQPSLTQYGAAAKQFAEERIAEGKTDIAYIDLTSSSVDFLTGVYNEMSGAGYDYGSDSARFYYYVSKTARSDYTHPNDYGADNFAKLVMDEAAEKAARANAYVINADADAEATRYDAVYAADGTLVSVSLSPVVLTAGANYIAPADGARTFVWDSMKPYALGEASLSDKVQANIFNMLTENRRDTDAVRVSKDIYSAGKAPNSHYPDTLVEVVKYPYPIILDTITFNDDGTPGTVSGTLVNSDLECVYAYVKIDVYDADGALKGSGMTSDFFDDSGLETQILSFDATGVVFDAEAGDTFRAYAVEYVDGEGLTDTVVSTTLTQDSLIDIKEMLIDEDFSDYITTGMIIGTNGWKQQGAGEFVPGTDGDVNYATFNHTDATKTSYMFRNFCAVSAGQLMVKYDLRYESGTMEMHLTDGTKDANNWSIERLTPLKVYTSGSEVKAALAGTEVCSIDKGKWTTLKLIVDYDYGKYILTVAGNTYTADIPGLNTTGTPSPAKLGCIAFIGNRVAGTYDLANMTVAALNTSALPEYTVALTSSDSRMGSVSGAGAYQMNTIVTLSAVPNEGYVFTNWTDSDGNVYSTDASMSFRLRENLTLTANFMKQNGLESVADYSIKASKSGLKAVDGNTLQLNITNPIDADGNPAADIANADAVWSCDTEGISIDANGVVSVDGYTLPENSTGKVTVTAVLNGVTKTFDIITYSYAYYETADVQNTNYTGAFSTIAGRTAMMFNTTKSSTVYTLGETIQLNKPTKIIISQSASGKNTASQKRYFEFLNTSGTQIMDMYYVWGGLLVGGTELPGVLGMNSWSDIIIDIDPVTSKATVTAAGNSATAACDCSNLSAIRFRMADNTAEDRLLGVSTIIVEQ